MSRRILNPQGFSLVEFLAAMAVLAIVAFSISKLSTDMVRAGVSAESRQERTNVDQVLTSLFNNSEICSLVLAGNNASEGTVFSIPPSIQGTGDLRRISITSSTIEKLINLNNNNFRATLLTQGTRKDANGSSPFSVRLPVYIKVASGKISSCFSERSAYSTCVALNGLWNDTYCDFCASLGGTRNAAGQCSVAKIPEPPAPPPPPTAPSTPTAPTPPTKKYVEVRMASGYNGTRTHTIGAFERCNLTRAVYDGDGIGECSVKQSGSTWTITIGDEGTRNPQVCYMACVPLGTVDKGGTEDGDLCTRNGKPGILVNGCCAIGRTYRHNYSTAGFGKNQNTIYSGLTNDIGCIR